MNKQRRKQLSQIIEQLETLKEELETIKCDEEEAFENLPESIQEGERGEKMQEAIDYIYIDDAFNSLEEAIGGIQSATE